VLGVEGKAADTCFWFLAAASETKFLFAFLPFPFACSLWKGGAQVPRMFDFSSNTMWFQGLTRAVWV